MRGKRRFGVGVLLVFAATAVLGTSPSLSRKSSKKCAPRHRCCKLRGATLLRNRTIWVVSRRVGSDQAELLGCAFRVGRTRELGSSFDAETTTTSAALERHAGTYVAVRTGSQSQYGASAALRVTDLATGRGYTIVSSDERLGDSSGERASVSASGYRLNMHGQAVAKISTLRYGPQGTSGTVQIVGFGRRGRTVVLDEVGSDDVPEASLGLHGATATWTHNGEQRSATLPT